MWFDKIFWLHDIRSYPRIRFLWPQDWWDSLSVNIGRPSSHSQSQERGLKLENEVVGIMVSYVRWTRNVGGSMVVLHFTTLNTLTPPTHESRNLFLNANYFLDSIIIFLLDEMRFQLTHHSSITSKLPLWWQRAFIHVLQIYQGKFRLSGYMNNKPKMAIYFMTLMMRMYDAHVL